MNIKLTSVILFSLAVATTTFAQENENKKEKKEENIIIRKKGTGKEKVTVVVDGEVVTVNGKPIDQFKDANVEIVRSQKRMGARGFNGAIAPMPPGDVMLFKTKGPIGGNKAFLGVSTEKDEKGAKIISVGKESAAEKAGLQKGDIITKVGDTKIEDAEDLYQVIGKYKPEEKVTVYYLREGKEATTTATLVKAKLVEAPMWGNEDFDMEMPAMKNFSYSINRKPKLGFQIQDVEEGNGVKILDVDDETPAAKAGLKKDDIITEIDGKEVKNVDDLKEKMKDLQSGDSFKLKYKREGKNQSTELKVPKKLKTANL